jgi:predicted ArsR family transcriptional regulator
MKTSTTQVRRHGEEKVDFRLGNVWNLVKATLREIFDESAYEHFLLRTNAARSVASYRDYMRERDAAMAKKPRCC